jgi:hypothetical protein
MVSDMSMDEGKDTDLENLLKEAFKSTNKDKNYNAIKGAIGLLPAGSSLSEFYSTYIVNPAQERLRNFLYALVNELKRLEDAVNDFSIESLESNHLFTTLLIRSFDIVKRNHQEEKILILNNFILNSVLMNSIKDDLKLHFLDLIDQLKASHFSLLYLAYDYTNYKERQAVLDDINANKNLYSVFLNRLISEELISFENAHNQVLAARERADRLNSRFVEFSKEFNPIEITLEKFEKLMSSSKNIELLIYLLEKKENNVTELGDLFIKFIKSPFQNIFQD